MRLSIIHGQLLDLIDYKAYIQNQASQVYQRLNNGIVSEAKVIASRKACVNNIQNHKMTSRTSFKMTRNTYYRKVLKK